MSKRRTDLLSATRVLLTFAMAVAIVAIIGASIALVLGHAPASRQIIPPLLTPEQALLAARTQQAVRLVGGAMAVPVLWLVRAIVDSARSGDPFVPENGVRLRRIGWLILAANHVFFAGSFALPPNLLDQINTYPGVVTALLVFVLARIFEAGTRMRTEIQETI
jgi:uncharacterized BrkB/YihY/UPF0761 family membrane protein